MASKGCIVEWRKGILDIGGEKEGRVEKEKRTSTKFSSSFGRAWRYKRKTVSSSTTFDSSPSGKQEIHDDDDDASTRKREHVCRRRGGGDCV